MLIEHRLGFPDDWLHGNTQASGWVTSIRRAHSRRINIHGHRASNNHFSVGPAILWSPFLIVGPPGCACCTIILAERLPRMVSPSRTSWRWLLAPPLYGFLARTFFSPWHEDFVPENWAFLAALGIWFGSPLPVYNVLQSLVVSRPRSFYRGSFSLGIGSRTRGSRVLVAVGDSRRTRRPDVKCILRDGGILLLLPLVESIGCLLGIAGEKEPGRFSRPARSSPATSLVRSFSPASGAFLPTLITKHIIYRILFENGIRTNLWRWNSPAFLRVSFSAEPRPFQLESHLDSSLRQVCCLPSQVR